MLVRSPIGKPEFRVFFRVKQTEIRADTDRNAKGLGATSDEIKAIRARWAGLTNERLKDRGMEARIDHRTLEAQGIDRVPTTHLGVAVWGMERRGIETQVGLREREQRPTRLVVQIAL